MNEQAVQAPYIWRVYLQAPDLAPVRQGYLARRPFKSKEAAALYAQGLVTSPEIYRGMQYENDLVLQRLEELYRQDIEVTAEVRQIQPNDQPPGTSLLAS